MLDLIWDLWQQGKIRDLERQQGDAAGRVTDAQERVRAMDETVGRLMTTTAAMWSLVKERTGLTDQELLDRVKRMEEEEGKGQAVECAKCGRTISARQRRCMYCGAEREGAGVMGR
jgi:hypothetical protein